MDENLFSLVMIESEKRKKEALQFQKKRYLYEKLAKVPNGYFVGICGLRGIGKTVLLLQLANETENSLYFSSDASSLKAEELYGIVRFAVAKGYRNIFIDEIHYKENWQQDLKTIYDEREARIIFSGSAALEIKKGADLSRRALLFHLNPLSFREYLVIKRGVSEVSAISATELFDAQKRKGLVTRTAGYNERLHEYFRFGGLLYPSEDTEYFYKALENALEKTIHRDLEYLRAIDANIESTVYKILEWIAISPVGEVNYSRLSSRVAVSKPTLIRIIHDLVRIGIIKQVLPCGKDRIRKEPKLYLAFPFREFISATVARKADIGSLREEFFVNHVEQTCYLKSKRGERTPDFTFEGKVLEIGGEGKRFYQNPDFIVKDGITIEEKTIPLYLIGFLY